ncbi:anti-sigma factor [Nocardia cyriacigeorgica]|uniref:anti-sigma factor n=1 Tax=Nocardia cyriacigeorgica TaxID=135487 RepID=UPI0024586AE4|nr:anti-sigma factor [Nocardia cyriacigeorgica]
MTDAPSPEHPDDHDLLDLAHLYALDAVSDTERASIEHRLRVCGPDIRRAFDDIVRETREAMGALSILDAKAPPQQLEAKILAAIAERAAAGPAEVSDGNRLGTPAGTEPHEGAGDDGGTDELSAARLRRRKVMRWVAAAAAVAAVVAIGAAVLGQRTAEQSPTHMVTADQVLQQPDARTATSPVSTGGTLIAHISDELDAVAITFDAVPAPPAGSAHQLWLIGPEGVPRSAGVLSDLPTVGAPYVTEFAPSDQLAMTVEPAGGSPGPTTDPIAALPLS